MAFYEKFWKCSACGKKEISALRKMKCPSCGSTKSRQDEEYLSGVEITDDYGLELASGKPHWTCSNCGSVNLDKETNCYGCGNGREESDSNNKVVDLGPITLPKYNPKDDSDGYFDEPKPTTKAGAMTETNQTKGLLKLNLLSKKWLIGLIVAFGLVVFGWLFFHTVTVEAKVDGFSWTRTISIERYRTVHESGWFPPAGSYNVWTEIRIARYEPIYETRTRTVYHPQTSYRDLGNGSVQSYDSSYTTTDTYLELVGQNPIYATWYEYDIDKWIFQRSEVSSGKDREPYWPDYDLNLDGFTVIGAERIGGRNELYQVVFETIKTDKENKILTHNVSLKEWMEYKNDTTYKLKINHLGIITNNPLNDKEK